MGSQAVALQADCVTRLFGGLAAVSEVSLKAPQGEIVGLIGPNGAGKTTLFNLISGALPVTRGTILFEEKDITRTRVDSRCRLGIARTFQAGKLFSSLTVFENVAVSALFGKAGRKTTAQAQEETHRLLEFVGLQDKANVKAKGLTLAAQRRLEVARALATKPRLLLLDEVLAGLTPAEVAEGVELIRRINQDGTTILIVEHIMKAIMGLSDHVVVLHHGVKIAEGLPSEIAASKTVQEVYLGEEI
jgi:branched-chain amino acid transport system ATP-binding protein